MFPENFHLYAAIKAVCGAVGAYMTLLFYRPKKLESFGPFTLGVVVGAIGAFMSVFFSGRVLSWFGADPNDVDAVIAAAASMGILSLGIVAWIGLFMERRANKDISEIIDEIRGKGARDE